MNTTIHSNSKESKRKSKTSEAVKTLIESLKKDKGLKQSYVANIAMCCFDEVSNTQKSRNKKLNQQELLQACNKGAENFIDLLCS